MGGLKCSIREKTHGRLEPEMVFSYLSRKLILNINTSPQRITSCPVKQQSVQQSSRFLTPTNHRSR